MFNLKYLIILALISFCFQDKNCLVYFEQCEDKYDNDDSINIGAGSVANCQYGVGNMCYQCKSGYVVSHDLTSCVQFPGCESLKYGDNTKCDYCEDGYALSSDQSKCVKFDNCIKLEEGETKCKYCKSHFHENKDGKCERTLCSSYDSKDVCMSCYNGYYLNKDKNCVEITVQNCLQVDPNNSAKCTLCVGGYNPDDGQCVLPSTLIKGCTKYDKTGKCIECESYDYEGPKDGTCTLKACKTNEIKVDYCASCKKGYYKEDGLCTSYVDGSKDTSFSSRNGVDYTLLILILGLLI